MTLLVVVSNGERKWSGYGIEDGEVVMINTEVFSLVYSDDDTGWEEMRRPKQLCQNK